MKERGSGHPYADSINWPDRKDHVVGKISPARLIQVARQVADDYKTYNVVFNNCQNFANDLRKKIATSMTLVAQNGQPSNEWTARDATAAVAGGMAAAGVLYYAFSKIFGSNEQEEEEKEDSADEEAQIQAQ